MSEFIQTTANCFKYNAKIKRSSRILFFIIGFGASFLLLSITALNVYFFYLMLAKILIWFNSFYFTLINGCANTPHYFEIWTTSDMRTRLLNERMKAANWWIVKFSIFSTILFIFFRSIIGTSTKYPVLVSSFTPAIEEIFFILIVIVLSLLAVHALPYWYVGSTLY